MTAIHPVESTDADLVDGIVDGDREAFAALYDRYSDRFFDFAHSLLRDRQAAADVVTESFVVIVRRLNQLRASERFGPWAFSIVRREALRHAVADPGADLRGPTPTDDAASHGQQSLILSDLQRLVWDASAGLSDRDAAILDLHLRQGLSGADLAEAMDTTSANAYVLLSRWRDEMDRSIGSLLVARDAADACPQLVAALRDWNGSFSPLIRKRITRHIDACPACGHARSRLISPSAVFAAVPTFVAPPALRDRVLNDPRLVSWLNRANVPLTTGRTVRAVGPGKRTAASRPRRSRHRSTIITSVLSLMLVGGVVGGWLWLIDGQRPNLSDDIATTGMSAILPRLGDDGTWLESVRLSSTELDFGTRAKRAELVIENGLTTPIDVTLSPREDNVTVRPSEFTIEAGDQRRVIVLLDRSKLKREDGAYQSTIDASWNGSDQLISVTASVSKKAAEDDEETAVDDEPADSDTTQESADEPATSGRQAPANSESNNAGSTDSEPAYSGPANPAPAPTAAPSRPTTAPAPKPRPTKKPTSAPPTQAPAPDPEPEPTPDSPTAPPIF